jgi:hypothetical protein
LLGLWPWLPLPIGAAYLLVILVKFNQIIAATYLNADAASAPVIGELFGGSPAHRQVFLGQMGWFSTLIFELATRSLPLHRQLWEGAPYAMALASVFLIAWATWRVAGRWAAAIVGVLLLCAGPHTLGLLFSLNDHSTTWFSLALLAGLLVLFQAPPAWLRTWSAALIALLVGVVVGVNAASDLVLLVAGILPFLFAAGLTWLLRSGRASAMAMWWTLATFLVAAACDELTHAYMHKENVLTPPQALHNAFASAEALSSNFKLWWQSLMVLGNGNFFGERLGFASALQLLCAVLALIALALVVRFAWRELVASAPRMKRVGETDSLRIAWCAFWSSSAVLLSASFVFSSNPIDINSSRYLVGVIYAVAALLPLLAVRGGVPSQGDMASRGGAASRGGVAPRGGVASRGDFASQGGVPSQGGFASWGGVVSRVAVTAGATIFALSGLVSLLKNEELQSGNPSYTIYGQVAQVAAKEHLTVGYADYWDAAPIIWSTHFHLRAYPVQDCAPNLCWSSLHMITSWYAPRPHQRTFLLTNSAQPIPAAPMPNLGPASAVHQIGTITMYVYPYDIASRMMP